MKQQTILFVTNRMPFPLNDGGNLATFQMLKSYVALGWNVVLFSMNTNKHYVSLSDLPNFFHEITVHTFDINTDVTVFSTLKNFIASRKPNHVERFYDKSFEQELLKQINQYEPQVIQLESVFLVSYIENIRKESNAKIALRLHNIESQIWFRLADETRNKLKKFYLRDLAKRIRDFELKSWSLPDLLFPITENDASIIASAQLETLKCVLPYCIDIDSLFQTDNEKWVGYHIGAMDWAPNAEAISWFIESVFPLIQKENADFEFHFAGRNMPFSFHKYESNNLICAGEVKDAYAFIKDKKMLIVPLRSGGGIRVKILEALALGKVVVATSVAVQGIEGIENGKHFLLAETEEEFKQQILWVLSNKDEANLIGESARRVIEEKYDNKNNVVKLGKVWQQVLNEKRT